MAFHLYDVHGELQAVAYSEPDAMAMQRRFAKKNVPVKIEQKEIFTMARHVDETGRPI